MKHKPLHFLISPWLGGCSVGVRPQVAYLLAENAVYKEHFAKGVSG
jgi:hypothetical protein